MAEPAPIALGSPSCCCSLQTHPWDAAGAGRDVLSWSLCQEPQEQGEGKHSANLGEQTPGPDPPTGFVSLSFPFLIFPGEKAPSSLRAAAQ